MDGLITVIEVLDPPPPVEEIEEAKQEEFVNSEYDPAEEDNMDFGQQEVQNID